MKSELVYFTVPNIDYYVGVAGTPNMRKLFIKDADKTNKYMEAYNSYHWASIYFNVLWARIFGINCVTVCWIEIRYETRSRTRDF
jgi:hypothetical protein